MVNKRNKCQMLFEYQNQLCFQFTSTFYQIIHEITFLKRFLSNNNLMIRQKINPKSFYFTKYNMIYLYIYELIKFYTNNQIIFH